MYLEEITYYPNSCYSQFTPINYLLDISYQSSSDDFKAVMLAEVPAIFKKYNIPLHHDDLVLFLNPNDNIANGFDIRNVLNSVDSDNEEERKDALLTKAFIDFFEKIKYINFYRNDKLLTKAINERYGYYYNKYDSNRFEKFKQYLNNNIPDSGFYNVELLTDEDIKDCKMNWLDYKEQEFRRYFYDVRMYFQDAPAKFLSERFFKVYNILKDKYKEIEFNDASLNNDCYSIRERISSIYLNDIIYERSPKHFYKDYVTSINFKPSIYDGFKENFGKYFKEKRWQEYKKQINDDFCYKQKRMECHYTEKLGEIIDTLEAERVMLEENGYKDVVTLLPVLFQDYFRFSLKYEEEIEYFKNTLNENSNKNLAIDNMINYYGVENIPSELITYLTSDNYIDHNTIKKVKVYCNKKTN